MTTEQLVRDCRRSKPAAWDELLERYARLIWSVALRLGARDEEAEEVFQRTWVAIVEGIGDLREPRRLASWVAGTARYQTYRLFAEQGRHRRAASLEDSRVDASEPTVEPEVEQALEGLQRSAALHEALGRLDRRCRDLLSLLFFSDPALDYAAISRRTGLAVGSIGPIRARCLKRLRKLFTGVYHSHGRGDP
jgi:RNA polymerase sigma factor (sigma-70 family)